VFLFRTVDENFAGRQVWGSLQMAILSTKCVPLTAVTRVEGMGMKKKKTKKIPHLCFLKNLEKRDYELAISVYSNL